jgi:membrane protein
VVPNPDQRLAHGAAWTASILRWVLLAVLIVLGLAVLYRYAPDRDNPSWSWVSWGSAVATAGHLSG